MAKHRTLIKDAFVAILTWNLAVLVCSAEFLDYDLDPLFSEFGEKGSNTVLLPKLLNSLSHPRFKRSGNRDQACEMLIAVDEPLYNHYQRDMTNVTNLVKDLVQRLNDIYQSTVLRDHFNSLYFRVKEIRILFDFCTECNQTQHGYLREFSKMDFSDFCLAHVFTYRDFPAGVQGLAWRGTVCHNSWNTGFTTLLNHGVQAKVPDSSVTFAHEIGHNFGSPHDEDIHCTSDYIMSESGSSNLKRDFSDCSRDKIYETLTKTLGNPRRNCLKQIPEYEPEDYSLCGNGIVEGDEECDCGLSYLTCKDPCCYAARIDPIDLYYNESAVPCRTNLKHICLHPWDSLWQFGFVAPWLFLLFVTVASAIGLWYDWKNKKICFDHITKPRELIRSETEEQMARRLKRQSIRGEKIYVIKSPTGVSNGNTIPNGNGVPEAPQPGIVKQMKSQLEKR